MASEGRTGYYASKLHKISDGFVQVDLRGVDRLRRIGKILQISLKFVRINFRENARIERFEIVLRTNALLVRIDSRNVSFELVSDLLGLTSEGLPRSYALGRPFWLMKDLSKLTFKG